MYLDTESSRLYEPRKPWAYQEHGQAAHPRRATACGKRKRKSEHAEHGARSQRRVVMDAELVAKVSQGVFCTVGQNPPDMAKSTRGRPRCTVGQGRRIAKTNLTLSKWLLRFKTKSLVDASTLERTISPFRTMKRARLSTSRAALAFVCWDAFPSSDHAFVFDIIILRYPGILPRGGGGGAERASCHHFQ